MRTTLKFFLSLYAVALLTSMAGMELFGWFSALTAVFIYILKKKGYESLCEIDELSLPPLKIYWSLWTFLLVIIIGTFFNVEAQYSKLDVIGQARWVLLLICFSICFQIVSVKDLKKFFFHYVLFGGLVGAYSLAQHFWGQDILRSAEEALVHSSLDPIKHVRFWRSKGFFSQPLTYAYSMGIFLCIPMAHLFAGAFKHSKIKLILSITSISLCSASIMTSYSRGGWIAFLGSLLFLISYSLKGKMRVYLFSGLISLGGAFVCFSSSLQQRIVSIFDFSNGSYVERFDLWRANFEMFKEHPFFGIGYNLNGSMAELYLNRLGLYNHFTGHAHNNLIQHLAGTGILGLSSLLIFYVTVFWTNYLLWLKSDGWIKITLLGALAAQVNLHLGGITECNFTDGEVNHQIILIWAFVLSTYIKKANQKRSNSVVV